MDADDEDRDLAERMGALTPQQFRVLGMVANALSIQKRTVAPRAPAWQSRAPTQTAGAAGAGK